MDNFMLILLLAIGVIVLCQLFMIIGMNRKINVLKNLLGSQDFDEKPGTPPPPPPPPPPTQPPKK